MCCKLLTSHMNNTGMELTSQQLAWYYRSVTQGGNGRVESWKLNQMDENSM